MREILCILLALWCASASAGSLAYKWVDDAGVVHYSDRPREGAEEIRLDGPRTYTPADPSPGLRSSAEARQPDSPYDVLEIAQPGQEETLWNIGGELTVTVRVQPALRRGDRIELYYDGNLVENLPPGQTAFQLSEVWRGEHSLQAAIVDNDGRTVARSEPVIFYVQQTSIQNPRNPQRPRPLPRAP